MRYQIRCRSNGRITGRAFQSLKSRAQVRFDRLAELIAR
jgi:hypothetical protein